MPSQTREQIDVLKDKISLLYEPKSQMQILIHILADKLLEDIFKKEKYEHTTTIKKKVVKSSKPLTTELKQSLHEERVRKISDIVSSSRTDDPGVLMLAILLFDRFRKHNSEIEITPKNISTLTATIIMMACKTHDDLVMANLDFATITGFQLESINQWEKVFFKSINYQVTFTTTSASDLEKILQLMEAKVKQYPELLRTTEPRPRSHSTDSSSSEPGNPKPRPRSRSL
jgi:hypothetical protein